MVKQSMDSNERNTENLERDALRALDHYDAGKIFALRSKKASSIRSSDC